MRLLFVGTNRGGGGTESHLVSLARAVADVGHDVSAAVRPDDFIHRGLAQHGGIKLFDAEFRSRRDVRTIRRIASLAREVRPDWMIGTFKPEYWGLALAAKAAGVPLALFLHLDQRVRPLMVNRVTRFARAIIVPSQFLRQRTISRGLPPSRVVVLPNPINTRVIKPNPTLRRDTRSTLGLGGDDIVLGYVGRFEPQKGVATLARAFNAAMAANSRLRALWVGHGVLEQELRAITAEAGFADRHRWMPWLDDVRPAYAAMDMLALPSEGTETFGRVLVEAQACGLPVLGARNGGIPEACADGVTGLLVPPGDVGAWANAITELASNDEHRRTLAASARAFALPFDSLRVAKDFVRVLHTLNPAREGAEEPRADGAVTLSREAVGD